MVDGVSASVCPGRRQGARRCGQMVAVEPECPTEKGFGPGGPARGSKRATGISRRGQATSKRADERQPAKAEKHGARREVYLLVQPASLEVRAESEVYLLAQQASPLAHVLHRVCLPNHRHRELTRRHAPVVSPSPRVASSSLLFGCVRFKYRTPL